MNILGEIKRLIGKNHFCVIATASRDGKPHTAGVLYCSKDLELYVYTGRDAKKVRNIRENPCVAITIPVWRSHLPFAPPRSIQFQGMAEILSTNEPVAQGIYNFRILFKRIKITDKGGCFIHIRPTEKINTHGVGISVFSMARHPEKANRTTTIPP
jgi:uncharacterized protein YhbP (UPF0306 family)